MTRIKTKTIANMGSDCSMCGSRADQHVRHKCLFGPTMYHPSLVVVLDSPGTMSIDVKTSTETVITNWGTTVYLGKK